MGVCTELRGYNLIDMRENLTVEIMAINSTLECDLDVQDIEVPPCANIPCFNKECMLQKIEGLFVNLNVLESVVASIEGVIDSTCDNSDKTTSTEDFTVIVESLAALLQLYTPADLQKPVINEISGMIVDMSESTVCAADSEILKQLIVAITEMRLQIIDQITKTQGELLVLCGQTVDPSAFNETAVTPSMGPVLPFTFEFDLNASIEMLRLVLNFNIQILQFLIQIISGITVSPDGISCDDFFVLVMDYITLLVNGRFGELESAAEKILTATLSNDCSAQMIINFQIIVTVLTETNINIVATITKLTQTLVISRGIIVEMVSYEISFEDQASEMAINLADLRQNCAGMDNVGQQLVLMLNTLEIKESCPGNEGGNGLMNFLLDLTIASSQGLNNETIYPKTEQLLQIISSMECIDFTNEIRIRMIILIIQDTVASYVSQIALIEQRRLQLTGSLNFSISIQEVAGEFDFQLQEDIQMAQLRGLMLCGDFTDRSAGSIEIAKTVFDFNEGSCTGQELVEKAQKVTAMCSSDNLELDQIRENTQELVRCSTNLGQPLTEGELRSLEFILVSLSTFRVTFSSQIIVVQQKLSCLVGQKASLANLGVELIGLDGELYDPEEDEPTSMEMEEEMLMMEEWQNTRFAFSTMKIVISSILGVLDIEGSVESDVTFMSCSEFLLAAQNYFTMISNGTSDHDQLFDGTMAVIQGSKMASMEWGGRVNFLAESMVKSIMHYQMSLVNDLVILQTKLIQILQIQVSSLQICFNVFDEEGEIVPEEQGIECDGYSMNYFEERNLMYNNSIKNLQDIITSISAATEGTETFIPTEDYPEAKPVNSSVYMKTLAFIVMDLSVDMTNIDAESVSSFMSLSVDSPFSDRQMEALRSIRATLNSYVSQLAAEVAMGHSTMQDIKTNATKEKQEEPLNDSEGSGGYGEADMQAQMMSENIVNLNQTIEYMMNIEANCDMANENTPMEYYNFVINDFYLPLIQTDMTEMDSFWGSVEFGPLGTFEAYNDEGVMCLKGTHKRDLMAVQVVLKVYMEMAQLHMAIIHEEMLDMTGECPVGYQLGDWSDDSGECCCDPSYQPPEDTEQLTSEPEDGEEPIEIPAGGYGEEPIEIGGNGEEPIEIGGSGYGEEPITIGYGGGEEPVLIPSGDGEEPVEIPQGGYGEEPINISGGEEPVVIGGGEEPVSISFGEEPVSLSNRTAATMTPSSSSTPIGSRRRGQRDVYMSSTTSGPTGQSPISIPTGYGNNEQPVTVGYGNGEEPVTIENGYGGETPVTAGYGDGEEPVTIDGGEEPVTIPQGEEPVSVDGYGGYGTGEQPMEGTGYGISGEQQMEVTGYGEVTEEPTEPPVTFAPVSAPPRPETKPAAKCFPKKKFCKCRTTEPQVTGYGTGGPSVPSGRPTPGPGTNPSGEGSTGPGAVPTGPTGPTGTIPYLLGSSTASTPLTGQLPYLLTRSTASTVHIGSVPYLLTKTTPSTMFTTTFEGMMPYKLVRSSTPSTVDPTNAKKQA